MSGKRKRERERERMASRAEIMNRIERWLVEDEVPDGPFCGCSMDVEHDEECEHDCSELSKYQMLVIYEREAWKNLGVDVNKQLTANPFVSDIKLDALIDTLCAEDLISRAEFEEKYEEKMFLTLRSIRLAKQGEIKARQARNGIQIANQLPKNPRIN